MKMPMYYTCIAGAALLAATLLRYVFIILMRTDFGTSSTSIGRDVIGIVYGACFASCALASVSFYLRPSTRSWSVVIMVLAILPTVIFACLHFLGRVGQYVKGDRNAFF